MSASAQEPPTSAPADAGTPRPLVHGLLRGELGAFFDQIGQPAFRAGQVWDWLYVKRVREWQAMSNLPADLRLKLATLLEIEAAHLAGRQGATGETVKLLAELRDGERVEEVLIPAPDRRTVCVSSQVGCRFACAFCASGQAGFRRNLDAGEMVGQVLLAAEAWQDRPTHVVFMGIGEPFDNYDAVLKAIRILNDESGLGVGARRLTISTSGVVPGIRRLADEGLQVELSVSLHAPSDALRTRLMPINRRWPLAELMDACRAHYAATRRLITFEYTLIGGVNDTATHAAELVRLLSTFPARVNLIPLSPVEEFDGRPSDERTATLFIRTLESAGINATLRMSKGSTLNAACGQLRYARTDT